MNFKLLVQIRLLCPIKKRQYIKSREKKRWKRRLLLVVREKDVERMDVIKKNHDEYRFDSNFDNRWNGIQSVDARPDDESI